jgi:surface antigen
MATRWMMLVLAVLMALAVGCATKEDTGTLAGAGAGAVIGKTIGDNTASTQLGAVAGGLLGREIGRRMDEGDRTQVAQTLEEQPSGASKAWTNPDTGKHYSVTPTETFERDGQPCREFTMKVEGEGEPVTGTACRTAAGDWQVAG